MASKGVLMKTIIISWFLFATFSLTQNVSDYRPISTYSIVALDEKTGELGVAVQSHWFSVGSLVPWVKAGVGAIATQSFVKVDYGPDGLILMENGMSAEAALKILIEKDEAEAVRQVAMIDINGNVAAHTGSRCLDFANHVVGKNYSVQANMMENSTVPMAMARAFENYTGDLADKMMAALEAAENEGGDIRGKQSAAMVIMSGNPTGVNWEDTKMNLRIEDHPNPIKELKRLIRIHRAYQHANKGDYYLELNQIDNAINEYTKASQYYPENPELPYWLAVALANKNLISDALPIFKSVFQENPNLKKMTPRLIKNGLLIIDEKVLNKIMMQ